jgi:hypothetical protein
VRSGSRPAAAVQGAVGRGRERRRLGSSPWRRDERRGGRERERSGRGERGGRRLGGGPAPGRPAAAAGGRGPLAAAGNRELGANLD